MNQFVTGQMIKNYREKKNMTQQALAEILNVSSKTISKWESCGGLPDISLIEPLAKALGVSLQELFSGKIIENKNINANMLLTNFYVCPICGNVITSIGDSCISCHGITLVKEQAQEAEIKTEIIDDEIYVTLDSPMTKQDYISFVCGVTPDSIEIKKLYPEQNPETSLKRRGLKKIYFFKNREGLFYSNFKIQRVIK